QRHPEPDTGRIRLPCARAHGRRAQHGGHPERCFRAEGRFLRAGPGRARLGAVTVTGDAETQNPASWPGFLYPATGQLPFGQSAASTASACSPFCPWTTRKLTFWPSCRVLNPGIWIARKCTNTSSPLSRLMNPKPFASLNHFTVPISRSAMLTHSTGLADEVCRYSPD